MPLAARVNAEGKIEVRDDGKGCSITFRVHQLHGHVKSVPLKAVAARREMSDVDRLNFATAALQLAKDFAEREGLI